MNLKEAFRFQNKLGALMEEAQDVLDRDANITRVENTYLRKRSMTGQKMKRLSIRRPPSLRIKSLYWSDS